MLDDLFPLDGTELYNLSYPVQTGTGNYGNGGNSADTIPVSINPPSLSQQVNAILSEMPGFTGLCLAIDKAEQFPGIEWFPPNSIIHLPRTGNNAINQVEGAIENIATLVFDPQDYIGAAIYSIARTISDNFIPFMIRLTIASIGLLLIAGLMRNLIVSVSPAFQGKSLVSNPSLDFTK